MMNSQKKKNETVEFEIKIDRLMNFLIVPLSFYDTIAFIYVF